MAVWTNMGMGQPMQPEESLPEVHPSDIIVTRVEYANLLALLTKTCKSIASDPQHIAQVFNSHRDILHHNRKIFEELNDVIQYLQSFDRVQANCPLCKIPMMLETNEDSSTYTGTCTQCKMRTPEFTSWDSYYTFCKDFGVRTAKEPDNNASFLHPLYVGTKAHD